MRSRSKRRASGTYVLEGRRSLDQALQLGVDPELVFVTASRAQDYDAVGDRVRIVGERRLAQISSLDTSDGVLGVAATSIARFEEVAKRDCILLPIGLQDPGNLGTLLRSALAFFASVGLVVGPGTVDPFSPKVVRATTGLISLAAIHETDNYTACLSELGQRGVMRVALVPRAGTRLLMAPLPRPFAILIGSEAHGIGADLLADCDGLVSIPHRAQIDSLNAGVAGSIALFSFAGLVGG
ncbi:MAG: TrmH family RNA methyltransferase [Ferrimicrobium sp.]